MNYFAYSLNRRTFSHSSLAFIQRDVDVVAFVDGHNGIEDDGNIHPRRI